MKLEYRHNNGQDWVLLVEGDESEGTAIVRSDWAVTEDVIRDFCDCSDTPDEWDNRGGDEHRPEEYGDVLAVRKGHELISLDERWAHRVQFFCR